MLCFLANPNEVHDICQAEAQIIRKKWYIEYVKDCIQDDRKFDLEENLIHIQNCQIDQSLTSYDQCLLNNGVYKESMVPIFNCYYGKVENLYQLSKLEARNTNNSAPEIYSILKNCLENNEMENDIIFFKNCIVENADVIFSTNRPEKRYIFEKVNLNCNSFVDETDLKQFLDFGKFNKNIVPYLKCLHESKDIIEDECFYMGRYQQEFGNESMHLVMKCFREASGSYEFNYIDFYGCLYN